MILFSFFLHAEKQRENQRLQEDSRKSRQNKYDPQMLVQCLTNAVACLITPIIEFSHERQIWNEFLSKINRSSG